MSTNYPVKLVRRDINSLPKGIQTKDYDILIKSYIKKDYRIIATIKDLKEDNYLQRAFFFVNCHFIKNHKERFLLIDEYKDCFDYWWNTDQIIKLVNKCDYNFMFEYSKNYINDASPMIRRWGYVMYIFHPCKKDADAVNKLLTLFKDDDNHDVMMAEAWTLCEFAIFFPDLIYDYLDRHVLNYKITSMAIGKIRDSYRIDESTKQRFIMLREKYRETAWN